MRELSDFRIIFVPGYNETVKSNWYKEISNELDYLGADYKILDMPDIEMPSAKKWVDVLNKVTKKIEKPLVFVGYGLGTLAIQLFMEKFDRKIDAVFLVSCMSSDSKMSEKVSGIDPEFFNKKDLSILTKRSDNFVILHSQDDPNNPLEEANKVADALGAKVYEFDNLGAFNDPSDYEIVLDILLEELDEEGD